MEGDKVFNFSNLRPKKEVMGNNDLLAKYPWRENIKQVIQYLSHKGYYNPNHPKISATTNERIFDILDANLDEKIDWNNVACITSNTNENLINFSFFDTRPYFVIRSSWRLETSDVPKLIDATRDLGPKIWEIDTVNNKLEFSTIIFYPFNSESLENGLRTLLFFEDVITNSVYR